MRAYIKKKRKGSSSIFLMIILASMITLVFAFVSASIRIGAIGYCDGIANLSARSVLSEYDTHLKDEYGLFAFRGYPAEVSKKLSDYMGYTLDQNKYLDLKSVSSDMAGYSLADVDIFEKEVVEYTKYALARNLIDEVKNPQREGEGNVVDKSANTRVLRNEKIKSCLPSGGQAGNGSLWKTFKSALSSYDKAFKSGTTDYLVTRYIMSEFKNASKTDTGKETFFKNEVEYILEGEMGDDANRKAVRSDIVKLRNAANFLFIWLDPVKRSEVMAAAAAATPGPWATLTALGIAEGWALAEAENDMKLLEAGKKVPVYKTSLTWALDLESVSKNSVKGYVDTHAATGLTYSGYLECFLFFEERQLKLKRMMDLMQINIQGRYDKSFLIQEHNMGFNFSTEIDGRTYSYEEKY